MPNIITASQHWIRCPGQYRKKKKKKKRKYKVYGFKKKKQKGLP